VIYATLFDYAASIVVMNVSMKSDGGWYSSLSFNVMSSYVSL
jgi:hypothetical protein